MSIPNISRKEFGRAIIPLPSHSYVSVSEETVLQPEMPWIEPRY